MDSHVTTPEFEQARDQSAYEQARASAGRAHETPELHRLLVESVRDYAIFALDATGHVLSWNRGAQRIKGYSPHEIIGKHFSVFYGAEDRAAGKPEWELAVATRDGSVEDEGWRIRKDGTRFWANVVITALRDANGQLVGFAKVTRDLTERRAAEEQIRESEERLRLVVQSITDYGIFMLDPSGHIASWNEGAQRIEGYTEAEIIGKHFSIFYPPEDIAWDKPSWELRVATEMGRFEDLGWRLRKDGGRFWANVVITPLHNARGELVGFAKVTRDLTERRAADERALEDARRVTAEEERRLAAEERARALSDVLQTLRQQSAELERQRHEAEQANSAKSQFLAAMSHELRTPLNAIAGYAELMLLGIRGPVTDQQREDLERIRQSQQHLLGIINDILNYSRLEAGQVHYDIGPVAIEASMRKVTTMIELQATAKGLRYEMRPCEATAWADATKVEQILINLLSNAVKFTDDGGSVALSCDQVDGAVRLYVQDTGIGIPESQQKSIFEPFVQVGRTLSRSAEGTGLGLSISRDLARGMGGSLTVRSALGNGSTFTLTLPGVKSNG